MKKLFTGIVIAAAIALFVFSIPVYANHIEVGTAGDCTAPSASLSGSDSTSVTIVGPLTTDDPRDNFDRNANGYVCVGQILEGNNAVAVIHFDDKLT